MHHQFELTNWLGWHSEVWPAGPGSHCNHANINLHYRDSVNCLTSSSLTMTNLQWIFWEVIAALAVAPTDSHLSDVSRRKNELTFHFRKEGEAWKHIRCAIFLIISIVKTQRYEVKISDLNSQKTSGFIKEAISVVSGATSDINTNIHIPGPVWHCLTPHNSHISTGHQSQPPVKTIK